MSLGVARPVGPADSTAGERTAHGLHRVRHLQWTTQPGAPPGRALSVYARTPAPCASETRELHPKNAGDFAPWAADVLNGKMLTLS